MSHIPEQSSVSKLDGIGERIRAMRIRCGMTQSDLAGGDVTRNMLSRIENGAALPSLHNLCRIADKLGVPPGALLGDFDGYSERVFVSELTEHYDSGEYERVLSVMKGSPEYSDNEAARKLLCKAYIRLANASYSEGQLTRATELLRSAEGCLKSCSDSDRAELENGIFLLSCLISACSCIFPDDRAVMPDGAAPRLTSIIYDKNDLAVYLYSLSRLDGLTHSAYSMPIDEAPSICAELKPMVKELASTLYRVHIEAKLDLINADYLAAKAKLLTILEPEPTPAILYDIYKDLEFCCKCCGDFENAYKYSTARLALQKRLS